MLGVRLVLPVVIAMKSYFLVLEVPPSLRGSVEIGSLASTPNPSIKGCGGIGTTKGLCGLCT